MPYNKNLYSSNTSALDAGIIYDQNKQLMQDEINADVLTKSQQTLTAAQKAQVQSNLGIDSISGIYVGTEQPSDPNIKMWLDTDEVGADSVTSVNGKVGVITLNAGDVGLTFTDVLVQTSDFAADQTYSDYGYKATIALSGVTAAMVPDVMFAMTEATSGIFAPVAACYAGGVYIYASEIPESSIIIPSIICWRVSA